MVSESLRTVKVKDANRGEFYNIEEAQGLTEGTARSDAICVC